MPPSLPSLPTGLKLAKCSLQTQRQTTAAAGRPRVSPPGTGAGPVSAVAGESQRSHPFPWVLQDSRDSRRALLNLNQEKWAWPPPSLREILVSSSSSESQIKGWKSLKYGELDSVSSLNLTVTSFLEARSEWTVNHEA